MDTLRKSTALGCVSAALKAHVFLLPVLAAGCGDAALGEPSPRAPETREAGEATPFDVGAVIRQVHFAYHADGDDFTAGDATYAVRVRAGGGVAITPHMEGVADDEPAPLVLETVAHGRAGALGGARVAAAEVGRDGHLVLHEGAVDEHLRDDDEGVEQSWSFAARPEGRGDLTVRVRASGEDFAEATGTGLHFVDPATGLGLRYGLATWVDARGARTTVAPRFEAGEIVITVPASVVQGSAYPAVLDPTISVELGTDNPVYGPDPRERLRTAPSVASNGSGYLVVWGDEPNFGYVDGRYDVVGTRVDGSGNVLDPGGIDISRGATRRTNPAVAWDNGNYVVVWEDYRNGNADIYGARVSTSGSVLDANGIAISTSPTDEKHPRIASGGGNNLVVWEDATGTSAGSEVYGAVVAPSGALVKPRFMIDTGSADDDTAPDVAWVGSEYRVVWQDNANNQTQLVRAARISSTGQLFNTNILVSKNTSWTGAPRVSCNPGPQTCFAVWEDSRNSILTSDVYGARIDVYDTVLDNGGLAIRKGSGGGHELPAVQWNGTTFQVAWVSPVDPTASGSPYQLEGALVTMSGTLSGTWSVLDANVGHGSLDQRIGLALGGSQVLAVYQGPESIAKNRGLRLSTSGTVQGSTASLSQAANEETQPAVAFDGSNYLLVWADTRGGGSIWGTLVSTYGAILAPSGLPISPANVHGSSPSVSFDNVSNDYLVVWSNGDIYGALVKPTGAIQNTLTISTAANTQTSPKVVFDGTDHLVVWADYRNGYDYDVFAGRVSKAGSRLDGDGFAVSQAAGNQTTPAVACDPTNCLVVWADTRSGTSRIYGSRVSKATGAVLDGADGLALTTVGATVQQSQPAIAWNASASNYVVVWADYRDSRGPAIYDTRVDTAGHVSWLGGHMSSQMISSTWTSFSYTQPTVACNGTSTLVAYAALPGGGFPAGVFMTNLQASAYEYPISQEGDDTASGWPKPGAPAVVWGGGYYFVAHAAYKPAPFDAYRVRANLVTLP